LDPLTAITLGTLAPPPLQQRPGELVVTDFDHPNFAAVSVRSATIFVRPGNPMTSATHFFNLRAAAADHTQLAKRSIRCRDTSARAAARTSNSGLASL
jgi:hypothetical protein